MKPSKVEWGIALLLCFFLFASWEYGDTTVIVGYEIDFADAIIHGEFSNPWQKAYDRVLHARNNNYYVGRNIPVYDLPVNLVLGIWGIPLYLLGGIEHVGRFGMLLYGKSLFFIAFVFSAWLVYKICRAMDLSNDKSKWAAFIYFTSVIAWNSVCLIGNIDAICVTLTLAGVLAYIRGRDRECFVWFLLAFPFKQFAAFIYLPLLLIRDKNILRDGLKLIAIAAVNTVLSLAVFNCPGVAASKTEFTLLMFRRLFKRTIPFLSDEISIFVLLYGLLCIYCWLTPEPSGKRERNHITIWVAMTAIIATLSSIPVHEQWFLYITPYLAAAVMYYGKYTEKVIFFEALGCLALQGYNFVYRYQAYRPKLASNMLLNVLLGKHEVPSSQLIVALSSHSTNSGKTYLDLLQFYVTSSLGAVYTACMIVIIFWLCRPQNIDLEREINLRPYALPRLFINAFACYIPLLYFIKVML